LVLEAEMALSGGTVAELWCGSAIEIKDCTRPFMPDGDP
jgi:hypothetical protein